MFCWFNVNQKVCVNYRVLTKSYQNLGKYIQTESHSSSKKIFVECVVTTDNTRHPHLHFEICSTSRIKLFIHLTHSLLWFSNHTRSLHNWGFNLTNCTAPVFYLCQASRVNQVVFDLGQPLTLCMWLCAEKNPNPCNFTESKAGGTSCSTWLQRKRAKEKEGEEGEMREWGQETLQKECMQETGEGERRKKKGEMRSMA